MPDGSGYVRCCAWCDEPALEHEPVKWIPHLGAIGQPVVRKPWHVECFMRSVFGGLNHLKGICTCCGGTEPPDPPEMTKREAAIAAVRYYSQFPASTDLRLRRQRFGEPGHD